MTIESPTITFPAASERLRKQYRYERRFIAKNYPTIPGAASWALERARTDLAVPAPDIDLRHTEHNSRFGTLHGFITVRDGVRFTINIYHDADTTPAEYECYDATDLRAWQKDEWSFLYVHVAAIDTTTGITIGEAGIGGVEYGYHWSIDADIAGLRAVCEHALFAEALPLDYPLGVPLLARCDA